MASSSISSIDSLSASHYPFTDNDMAGIERAKQLLEKAACGMTSCFTRLIEINRKMGVHGMDVDLVMLCTSVCTLSACYSALDEVDSDEEEGGTDSDESSEEQLDDDYNDSEEETVSQSDSLHSTITSSHSRVQLERIRGIKKAKSMLEKVLYPMMDKCTSLMKRNAGATGIEQLAVPISCVCMLLICYLGLDEEDDFEEDDFEEDDSEEDDSEEDDSEEDDSEEDDSDEEQSDIESTQGEDSIEQEEQRLLDENPNAGERASDVGSISDSFSSGAAFQTATGSRLKRLRDEDPSLVTTSPGKCLKKR